jgi:VanZ family protein
MSRKRKIYTILAVLALLFIWGNSLLPANASGAESGWVEHMLAPMLAGLSKLGVKIAPSMLVRKAAHFIEYFVFGYLVYHCPPEDGKRFLSAEAACLGAASVDECIQLLSPGRGPAVRDVLLDFTGGTCGVLLALLILRAIRKNRARRS